MHTWKCVYAKYYSVLNLLVVIHPQGDNYLQVHVCLKTHFACTVIMCKLYADAVKDRQILMLDIASTNFCVLGWTIHGNIEH